MDGILAAPFVKFWSCKFYIQYCRVSDEHRRLFESRTLTVRAVDEGVIVYALRPVYPRYHNLAFE